MHGTQEKMSDLNLRLTKKQIKMNQERDESMARMMTEHVMRGGHKIVNTVSINSSVNLDEANFKAMYNEAL